MSDATQASKKLKIWHIAELYPPDYGGGAAVYIQEVCRFQAEQGHDVRVLCVNTSAEAVEYSVKTDFDGSVRVERVKIPFRERDPGGWHLSISQWRRHKSDALRIAEDILRTWQPDVVQFHTPYTLIEEILPSVTKRDLPVVGMLHCAWLICPRLNLIKSPTGDSCSGPAPVKCLHCLYSYWDGSNAKSLVKLPWRAAKLGASPAYRLRERDLARRQVDGLIGYSKYMADTHRDHINGEVVHISLGVDMDGLPPERPVRPRNPVRFGFAGGFQEHKGIWDVLDTVKSLKDKGFAFELHAWGPNQSVAPLAERGIEDVVFLHGMFEPPDKWKIYAEMDVLLMATRRAEPYGRVVQEAAAMGVPTIAPAVGGITEQIDHEVNGFLFKFLDRADLERYMTKIIEEPTLVSRFSEDLWQVVDTRQAVAQIETFYYDLIERRKQKRLSQSE